jgi:protocatechuate 3,4-dioxygenase alpha subunit
MNRLPETPSQTVGPYFSMRLAGEGENRLAPAGTPGERLRVEGRVLDGDRAHIEDALLEIWQANAGGRYRHADDTRDEIALEEGFTGFGRAASDFSTGEYWFETVKPGPVPDPEGEWQAPHLNVVIQARGMLLPSFTRIYFSDEAAANDHDMVLRMVPAARRSTLIAQLVEGTTDPHVYRFDFKFQGDDETVFFDF